MADVGPSEMLSFTAQGKQLICLRTCAQVLDLGSFADASLQMLFFGSRCERLCMMQFSLISLIPGLIRKLQDCADPELNGYEKQLTAPTNLRTSDRRSLQAYMGLPLQIFGKVRTDCSGDKPGSD